MITQAQLEAATTPPELVELVQGTPAEPIGTLYDWATNYEAGRNPFTLFLDLIGWSAEHVGEPLMQGDPSAVIGYVEAGQLGDALSAYADHPALVRDVVDALMRAESGD